MLTSDDVQRLLNHKPKSKSQARIQSLAILHLDTGLRITEALALKSTDVDLDNFLIRVQGKGRKERLIQDQVPQPGPYPFLYFPLSMFTTALMLFANRGEK